MPSIRTRLTDLGVVVIDALGAAVVPGILVAKKKRIRLKNNTGGAIDVFLTGVRKASPTVSIRDGQTKEIPVDAAPGIHPFAVFSRRAGDFARGNSSPRIIIQ